MLEKDKSLLSYDEQTIIAEMIDRYQITQKNTHVLIKYYTHFLKTLHIQNPSSALQETLLQIALIFTEKSNFYKTLEGLQCPGICFSMNDILKNKSYQKISNLVSVSKQVLETVKFREISLKIETQKLIREIEEGSKEAIIFEKLCLVFFKNTLDNSCQTQSYKEKLINFSWFLYIDAKNNCLQNLSTFDTNKLLMVSVLEMIILNSLPHINPLILQKNSPKRYNLNVSLQKKEVMSTILEILLKELDILPSQIIQYQEINQTFNNYFDCLVSGSIIKSFSQERFDFLCQRSLEINFRKLDRKISKEIQSNQVDLRRLISHGLPLEKDHKKTAIEDKLIVKHKKNTKTKTISSEASKRYKSHRVLDLDNCEIEMNSSSVLTESEINFPPNLILDNMMRMSVSGLNLKTQKDELKKFLIQKTRPYMGNINSYQPSIMNYIENTFNQISGRNSFSGNSKSIATKSQNVLHAYEFYTYLTQKVWISNQQVCTHYILQQSDSTHECLLILAMGTILLSEYENESSAPIIRLLSHLKPNIMDFFYALLFVQQFDFPSRLKNSLKNVMENLINEFLWIDSNFIEEVNSVAQSFIEIHQENSDRLALSCILQKVSEYVSEKIKFIFSQLAREFSASKMNSLKEWRQKCAELALSFVIYCPEIIEERLLDQLILCSMYGMSKFHGMSIRFHELIQAYNKSTESDPIQFQKTILHVKSTFSEGETDIIGFYNAEFIGYLNYAFDIIGDRKKMEAIFQLCGDFFSGELLASPFKYPQQAIIMSPKLKKHKFQTHSFKGIQKTMDKQNYQENANHSIEINLDHEGQLGIVSFVSDEISKSIDSSQTEGKIFINLQINQTNSRNPTRVKERKGIDERENELCATHKGKHPIFTELRKIDEE